jgi:hypothetical protein
VQKLRTKREEEGWAGKGGGQGAADVLRSTSLRELRLGWTERWELERGEGGALVEV